MSDLEGDLPDPDEQAPRDPDRPTIPISVYGIPDPAPGQRASRRIKVNYGGGLTCLYRDEDAVQDSFIENRRAN